jgi:ankyrin repeat protein
MALISASAEEHEEIMRLLLNNDAGIEASDEEGRTALVFAAAGEQDGILRALDEVWKVEYKPWSMPT